MVASPYGLPSARDADEAASWAARWVRDVVGPQTAVHVLMPDASGGSRIIWGGGERLQMGPDVTAKRQEALGSTTFSYLTPSSEGEDCFGFFPLLSRGGSLGVLEILAPEDVLRNRWEAAALRRDLLRAVGPEAALRIAGDSIWREFGVPVCIWWSEHEGPLVFSAASGVPAHDQRGIRGRLGTIPAWATLTTRDRASIRHLFGVLVGAKQVTAREAEGAVLMVGGGEPQLRRRIRAVGSLLEEALPLLAASARERRRNVEIDLGLAWTAHEVRGPLLSFKAALELLVRRGASGDDALLRLSLRELEQLVGDTDGILGWAVGSRPLRPSYLDVTQLVEAAVDSYRLEAAGHTIEVVASPRPAMAVVDPTHLRAAVANLVRNAVAYSAPGSAVVVQVVDEGPRLRLSVRDEGPGIPVAERESIFDPFVRGEAGARRGRGSGLGLFITRRVVEAHGGKVWVDPGHPGAIFQMLLPVEGKELQRFAS